jgi:hypothetical protein
LNHYPIYGGPLAGNRAEEASTLYSYRENVAAELQSADNEGEEAPRYTYDLIANGDSKAFLPREDKDLLAAYQRTTGEPDNPEADALLREIERRHLDAG